MLLKECYDSIGGSYESVKERISNDEIIKKFLIMFLSERSYGDLTKALDDENYEAAFYAAHSLKGVCANLSLDKLDEASSELTEMLRGSDGKKIDSKKCNELFEKVIEKYNDVLDAIKKFVL